MTGNITCTAYADFNYEWIIDNFSERFDTKKAIYVESPVFYPNQLASSLILLNEHSYKNISLIICLNKIDELKIKTQFNISVTSSKKKEENLFNGKFIITKKFNRRIDDIIKEDDIINNQLLLEDQDKLRISFCMTFLDQVLNVQFDCLKNSRILFENMNFSDVTFCISGKSIKAHKAILANKSSVFYAMFSHKTKDTEENLITITDVDYDVMIELIRFIYTGTIKNLEKIVMNLLAAANKYHIIELMDVCENFLCQNLSIDNAVETFAVSHLQNITHLEVYASYYISKNLKNIIKTPGFQRIKESNSLIALEALCSAIDVLYK